MTMDLRITTALSVQSKKGVYAVLLGSGVSRPARIPTGWEIVEDLICQFAELEGEDRPADPEAWYLEKAGEKPTYAGLLEHVGKTPADRSNRIKTYIEPTQEDREFGRKVPTEAHHAIARLVAKGFIRVIVTTNFDRLLEQALTAEGVSPTVVNMGSSIPSMSPLQHNACTVVKLHGDYLDLSTKNTEAELAEYDDETNGLLSRVFAEYGLIVCGWSGDWDEALRKALLTTSNRYSTFWLARGEPSNLAESVIQHRKAEVVEIESADEFFVDLEQKVIAAEDRDASSALSVEMAFDSAKLLLSKPEYRIRLGDLVVREAKRVRSLIEDRDSFPLNTPDPSKETIRARADQYAEIVGPLAATLFIGSMWGGREHWSILRRAVEYLLPETVVNQGQYFRMWKEMKMLPASLCVYSIGIGSVLSEDYGILRYLYNSLWIEEHGQKTDTLPKAVSARCVFLRSIDQYAIVDRWTAPGSEWVFQKLLTLFGDELPAESRYSEAFNRYEALQTMASWYLNTTQLAEDRRADTWVPDGRYFRFAERPSYPLQLFREEIKREGMDWPPLKEGMFGNMPEHALNAIEYAENKWAKHHRWGY